MHGAGGMFGPVADEEVADLLWSERPCRSRLEQSAWVVGGLCHRLKDRNKPGNFGIVQREQRDDGTLVEHRAAARHLRLDLTAGSQPGEELFLHDHVRAGQGSVESGGHVGGAWRVPSQFERAQTAGQFGALAVGEVIHFFEDLCEAHRVRLKRSGRRCQ